MLKRIIARLFGKCKSNFLEPSRDSGTTTVESRAILVTYHGGTLVLEV